MGLLATAFTLFIAAAVMATSYVSQSGAENSSFQFMNLPVGSCVVSPTKGTWTAPGPPIPREGDAMAYDVSDGYVVLFGGYPDTGSGLADTWTYSGGCWTNITPTTSPPALSGASMVWDPNSADCQTAFGTNSGCLLLFGGCTAVAGTIVGIGILNDCSSGSSSTWEFLGGVWKEVTTTSAPCGRWDFSMTFDASTGDNFVLLYGGVGVTSACGGNANGDSYLEDTWKFVGGATPTWTELYATSAPGLREGASMTYDSSSGDNYVLLYGGYYAGELDNAWSFQSGAWSTKALCSTTCTPGALTMASAVWDPTYSAIILSGGYDGTNYHTTAWAYASGGWTSVCTSCFTPARSYAASAFDQNSADYYLLIFGGESTQPPPVLGDVWIYK